MKFDKMLGHGAESYCIFSYKGAPSFIIYDTKLTGFLDVFGYISAINGPTLIL